MRGDSQRGRHRDRYRNADARGVEGKTFVAGFHCSLYCPASLGTYLPTVLATNYR